MSDDKVKYINKRSERINKLADITASGVLAAAGTGVGYGLWYISPGAFWTVMFFMMWGWFMRVDKT